MDELAVGKIQTFGGKVKANVEKVIIGKGDVVELVILALLCEGHVLIEDIPGVGKTVLAKSIARSLGCSFHRIQCTPDLLPSDITGTYIFNQKTVELRFRQRDSSFLFDGVLRRQYHERPGQQFGFAFGGDLAFLHRFQQRGLRPRRGAVDFVGQHDLGHDGARPEFEIGCFLIEYVGAGDIRR